MQTALSAHNIEQNLHCTISAGSEPRHTTDTTFQSEQIRSNTPSISAGKAKSCSNMADSGNTGHVGATTSYVHGAQQADGHSLSADTDTAEPQTVTIYQPDDTASHYYAQPNDNVFNASVHNARNINTNTRHC
jgi:hypothetical protein